MRPLLLPLAIVLLASCVSAVGSDDSGCTRGCIVNGDDQNPETFAFEPGSSIAIGRFGTTYGTPPAFIYAALSGVIYAFEGRPPPGPSTSAL